MKTVLLLLIGLMWTVTLSAEAQQPKVSRIGYLSFDPASDSDRTEAIRLALRDLGHIEGQNIATEYRYSVTPVESRPARDR